SVQWEDPQEQPIEPASRSSCLMNPAMSRIFVKRKPSLLAGHSPQIVQPVSGRSRHGMIAVGNDYGVSVQHLMRDRLAVVRINHLMAEPLNRVDAIVIHLFDFRLAVAAVMLMRRIAAPVARGINGFTHDQPAHIRVAYEDV